MRSTSTQRGVAAIEFALVLVFLIPLAFGITELGRAFYQYNTLVKATRNGARALAAGQTVNIDRMTVYGNPEGSGAPLVDGLSLGMVDIPPEQTVAYEGGTMKVVTVSIHGFKFVSLVPGVIGDIEFGPISTSMRRG